MNEHEKWRGHAKGALDRYFRRRSLPRLILSLLLLITGAVAFLVSYELLRAGVDHMWLRYPIALLLSYAVLLGLIRIWVEIERARFDPADADVASAEEEYPEPAFRSLPHRQRSWLDSLDLPAPDLALDDGCLPIILTAVLIGLGSILLMTVAAAPALISEIFLDAFIVSVLYRRLRVAQKEHWLGTALRRTWVRVLFTALLLAIGGWTLEQMAPGARSIGKAIEQIRSGEIRDR